MGEVYQLDNAINHGVAEGYEGVDASSGQPSEKKFKKIFHVKLPRLLEFVLAVVLDIFLNSAGLKKTGGRLGSLPPEKSTVSQPSLGKFQLSPLVGDFLGSPDWYIAPRRQTDQGCSKKQ
jgi:hypothetical protein